MVVRVKMDPAKRDAYFKKLMSNWSPAAVTAFNGMIKAQAEDMVKFARMSVPKQSGHLASQIFEYRKESLWRVFTTGFRGDKTDGKGFYSRMVEFGTKPHEITLHKKKALHIGEGFANKVQHPGAERNPFFYPAYRIVKNKKNTYKNQAVKSLMQAVGKPV